MESQSSAAQGANRGRIVVIEYRLIQVDLTALFEAAGFEVKVLGAAGLKVGPFRALCREWKPDLLLSINYSPDLALLATFVRVPYVSWTIDPLPASRMAVRNGTEQASCLLFCHRPASVGDFTQMEFKDVRPLLLAAPHERRSPVDHPESLKPYRAPVSFVGNSLMNDSDGFGPVLHEHQLERRVEELDTFLQSIFEAHGHHAHWKGLTDSAAALPEEFLIYVTADNERIQCLEAANGRMAHLFRLAQVTALSDMGIHVWGDAGWDIEGLNYRGIANHDEELTKIYCASQINLDVPRLYQRDIITMRVFDVLASGGCLLAESSNELIEYFTPGEHLFTYSGVQDLRDKVAELTGSPDKCREVAENGRREVLEKHTLEHRFQVILEACYQRGWLKAN